MVEEPNPPVAVEEVAVKLESIRLDEEVINELAVTPEVKMNPEDFRFILLADGEVHFDSGNTFPIYPSMPLRYYHHFPPGTSFYQRELIDYRIFANPRFPTSKDFPFFTELIRVHKIEDYYVVTKMFEQPVEFFPFPKISPNKKLSRFDQLEDHTSSNVVPAKFWNIDSSSLGPRYAWQIGTPRDARDNWELGLSVVNTEIFRNRQMVRTVQLEDTAQEPRLLINREPHRRFVMAIVVPKEFRKFIINHLVYIDREMTRMRDGLFQWVRHPRLTHKLIFDRWNLMTREFMLVQSCSRIKKPIWAIGSNGYHQERWNYGKSIIDVVNRLDNKFVSKLLTAFLMNHLSWVLTASANVGKDVQRLRNYFIQEKIPYSYFSVEHKQYLEVIGSCGPHDTVKVVVLGKNKRDLVQLAEVFTFFIRDTPGLPDDMFGVEEEEIEIEISEEEEDSDMDECQITVDEDELEDEYELMDFFENAEDGECDQELYNRIGRIVNFDFPQPDSKTQIVTDMFAAPTTQFSNYFAFQGIVKTEDNQKEIERRILHELRQKDGFASFHDGHSDGSVPRKIFIVADIEKNTVRIVSQSTIEDFDSPAASVTKMISNVKEYQKFIYPTDIHWRLEEKLGSLVEKSMTFVEILKQQTMKGYTETRKICEILDSDPSDIPLIFKITSSYLPLVFSCREC